MNLVSVRFITNQNIDELGCVRFKNNRTKTKLTLNTLYVWH